MIFGLVACFTLPACAFLPDSMQSFGRRLQAEWDALLEVLQGKQSPLAGKKPEEAASPGAGTLQGDAAARAKANAELLHEMFLVIFLEEPEDRSSFGSYVDSLNQGASLEGVYNGFAHSKNYRRLEVLHRGASPSALTAFCEELAQIQLQLSTPTAFNEKSALPLPVLGQQAELGTSASESGGGGGGAGAGTGAGAGGVSVVTFGQVKDANAAPRDAGASGAGSRAASPGSTGASASSASATPQSQHRELVERYQTIFKDASIFTLKRVLADELLKLIYEKKMDRKVLSDWFAGWAVSLRRYHVDFGLEQRNSVDLKFHSTWAMNAPEDRLIWEALNRVHRLLNTLHREGTQHQAGGAT